MGRPSGTTQTIRSADQDWIAATRPAEPVTSVNVTRPGREPRPEPLSVTTVPGAPRVGRSEMSTGAEATPAPVAGVGCGVLVGAGEGTDPDAAMTVAAAEGLGIGVAAGSVAAAPALVEGVDAGLALEGALPEQAATTMVIATDNVHSAVRMVPMLVLINGFSVLVCPSALG